MRRIVKDKLKKSIKLQNLKFLFLLFLTLFLPVISFSFCQADSQSQSAYHIVYSHYLSASDEYRQKYDEFITARGKWRVYKTKIAKNEYQESLKQLLQARNEVLIKYLELHIVRIKQALGQISDTDYTWFTDLNNYREQLKTRQIVISQANSLDKLLYLSRLEEEDYTKFVNDLYYRAIYQPRVIFVRKYVAKIADVIQQYKLNPQVKIRLNQVEQQWLIDSQTDLSIVNSRLERAQKLYDQWDKKKSIAYIKQANQEVLGARADMLSALDRLIKININQ